jgi:hypothetical protein
MPCLLSSNHRFLLYDPLLMCLSPRWAKEDVDPWETKTVDDLYCAVTADENTYYDEDHFKSDPASVVPD